MLTRLALLTALALCSSGVAFAQTPLACSSVPQSVCENPDLLALESERAALVQQLSSADPQNAALANEQTWSDGLRACGEEIECYRSAYLNHNEALRQAAATLPGGVPVDGAAPLEAPADAPTVEEQIAIDEAQAERLREAAETARDEAPARTGDDVYAPAGLPGWGFWTMIGVTLLVFWWLMRTLKRNRAAIRAEEGRLRNAGFR